jgi:anti-anti-sigma factor
MTSASPRAGTEHGAGGDEVVVRVDEGLLADGLADLRWLLHDARTAGARRIVVDLSQVRTLTRPALACFLCAHRSCRARGGALALRGADRRTRDMLRRTGLRRVLQVEEDGDRRVA